MTALIGAAEKGRTETVNALLKAGAEVHAKTDRGLTALIRAAEKGRTETVNALLEAGADDLTDYYGRTALIYAARSGSPEIINALIDAGSYVKQKDNKGKTALDYARENPKLRGTDALKRLEELSRQHKNSPASQTGEISYQRVGRKPLALAMGMNALRV